MMVTTTSDIITQPHLPKISQRYQDECTVIDVPKGTCFVNQGDEVTYVYIVNWGTVRIFSVCDNAQQCMLSPVTAGGTIGEMEVICGISTYVYSASALQNCELVRMPKLSFLRWMREDFNACWSMTRILANKLYASSSQTRLQGGYDTLHRFVQYLLTMGEGRIPSTRQELADTCSMSLRSTQRCVEKLKHQGLVSINKGKIEISHTQFEKLSRILTEEDC